MAVKIVGIIGSYRKGKIIDSAVTTILEGAKSKGAQTQKIFLLDKHLEFCTNCRSCVQEKVQGKRGKCVHNDDMKNILAEVDDADAIVLGSPINFSTVTAIMKRFIERLIPYAYWPWGKALAPVLRNKQEDKKAIIITSSACPAIIGRFLMPNAIGTLKRAAKCMGAKVTKSLYFGPVAAKEDSQLSKKALLKARKTGEKLALAIQA
jgi:putative NADPH-quinone reductase